MGSVRHLGCGLVAAAALALCGAAPAAAGGFSYEQMAPPEGVALAGSPYRFQTYIVGRRERLTVVEEVDRRRGLVARHWTIRGAWHLSAPAFDGEGAGAASAAPLLVLERFGTPRHGALRGRTELAFLATRPGGPHAPRPLRRDTLRGDYTVQAVSPDGSTVYLSHNLPGPPRRGPRFTLVPYSLGSHRLLPARSIRDNGEILGGTAIARVQDRDGRRVFTLSTDHLPRGRLRLRALDTVGNSLVALELPKLRGMKNPLLLDLHLAPSGRAILIRKHSVRHWVHREPVVARVPLSRLIPSRAARASVAAGPSPSPVAGPAGSLAHAGARPGPVGVFSHVVGQSREGRPIELLDIGDPSLPMRLLVFGCIHGDECGARSVEPLRGGCPDGHAHVDVVPDLDPDGSAARSRLNADGVDLNRNFPAGWRPIGSPGDLEYAGPHPFSEPETRLAARLVRRLRPRVTIWFHQHRASGSFVRAWGRSVPAARRFAALAGLGFRLMRWPAGTAPHWQNRRFPGTASFVVELPRGKLPQQRLTDLDVALGRFGELLGARSPILGQDRLDPETHR